MPDTPSVPTPPTTQSTLPFVMVTVNESGNIQVQTNLKDKALILGLMESAKFLLMTTPQDKALVKPSNGLVESLHRFKP